MFSTGKLYIVGAALLAGVALQAWVINKAYNSGWNTHAAQTAAATAMEMAKKLSERSKIDAKLPDMDDAAACRAFGYKWVSVDGKNQCRQ